MIPEKARRYLVGEEARGLIAAWSCLPLLPSEELRTVTAWQILCFVESVQNHLIMHKANVCHDLTAYLLPASQ
jgi:hypothetical protein